MTRSIQRFGVFMTPFAMVVAGMLFPALLPTRLVAQTCSGTLSTSTQTASFSGNGNNTFNPNFTQYFPAPGYTVLSVNLTSKVTLSATFDLTNNNTPPQTVSGIRPGANEDDIVTFNGSALADDDGNTDVLYSKYVATGSTVNPGETVTVTAPNLINNKTMFVRNIDNSDPMLNDFIGSGSLNFTYTNAAGSGTLGGSLQVNPTFVVNTTFTLTYTICYTGVLASDILSFTAFRQDKQTVALNWLTTNETAGREYTVEVSRDNSSDFTPVATVPADASRTDANYAYSYVLRSGDAGKLYFRLKLTAADGSVGYSIIRLVDLGAPDPIGFSIYPNPPSDFINVTLPGASQDWQVDIIAADGSLVQRNAYHNSNAVRVNFARRYAAGTYFVRAVSPQTGKFYTGSFLVR